MVEARPEEVVYLASPALPRVLVTGGAGYIGSVLCRRLLNDGYRVRALDALFYGGQSLAELLSHERFELRQGDSRDVTELVAAMRNVDAVVHLGEIVGDPACSLDEQTTRDINLAATMTAAKVAKGLGVARFVYASSCSVYGASEHLLAESSELNPLSLYARAKVGAERALLDIHDSDFKPVLLRLATVFGLSPRPRFDLVVNLLTAKAVVDREISVIGGDQWRPFVHVTDVARAMAECLRAPLSLVGGQTFNVGSDSENYTIGQIGELVQQSVPGSALKVLGDQGDARNYRVSFAKIRATLGFEAKTPVVRGIHELRDALRSGAIGNYADARYSNVRALGQPEGNRSVRPRRIDYLRDLVPLVHDRHEIALRTA